MELLLVGIDAGCRPVIDPLIEAGEVPNLQQIFRDGVTDDLESQIPPWTPSAWPSIYTGKNPGQHGVFGFLAYEGYDWDLVNSTHVRARPLWNLLEYHDLTSVVVNVPVTHPPPPVSGAIVPGYMAPQHPDCHPSGVADDLREQIGDYRVYPTHTGAGSPSPEEMITEYRTVIGMRGDAFRYLTRRFDPEFGFVQFQQTDTVFHECPGNEEAVRAVYGAVDDEIGAIVDECEPETIVVVSDHGIGEYGGVEFRVNDFLKDRGFTESRRGGEGMPSWAPIRDSRLMERGNTDSGTDVLERVVTTVAKAGLTSQRIEAILDRLGLRDVVLKLVPQRLIRAGTEQVEFATSRAYMRSRIELGVRINLAGRDPDGVVPAEDYEGIRDRLIALLRDVATPAGDPVFEEVVGREAYFQGDEVDDAVDILMVPADFDHYLTASFKGDVFGEPTEPWNHKLTGIVAASGVAIDATSTPTGSHVFDIAPTVLAALGVPYDTGMDGEPLPFVESSGHRRYPAYRPRPEVSTESPSVESRLRDMGYLG